MACWVWFRLAARSLRTFAARNQTQLAMQKYMEKTRQTLHYYRHAERGGFWTFSGARHPKYQQKRSNLVKLVHPLKLSANL